MEGVLGRIPSLPKAAQIKLSPWMRQVCTEGETKDARGAPIPNQTRRDGVGNRGAQGDISSAMRKASQPGSPRPLPAGLTSSRHHLRSDRSHQQRRKKLEFLTLRAHLAPQLRIQLWELWRRFPMSPVTPKPPHLERTDCYRAQRCTRARALGTLSPATVVGRLVTLQGRGEGEKWQRRRSRRPGKH